LTSLAFVDSRKADVKETTLLTSNMANRRLEDQEMSRAKRPRIGEKDFDASGDVEENNLEPSKNPYLAHHYEDHGYDGYQNGNGYNSSAETGLDHFERHKTTAKQAYKAEDGPNNPFNNNPLSDRYFKILKTRRDLPVNKQR